MAKANPHATLTPLARLTAAASRPVYVLGSDLKVLAANRATADWIGVEPAALVGSKVGYHSETEAPSPTPTHGALCPPPSSLGRDGSATLSCLGRDGRLRHRRAQWVVLLDSQAEGAAATVVTLDDRDLTPAELAEAISPKAEPETLHHELSSALGVLQRERIARGATELLLGESHAMRRLRDQLGAAAASGCNALVVGPEGSARDALALVLHDRTARPGGASGQLLCRLDGAHADSTQARRVLEQWIAEEPASETRAVLLVERIDALGEDICEAILSGCRPDAGRRVIATAPEPLADEGLAAAVATITLVVPPLAERLGDLPLLAQLLVERENARGGKQLEGLAERSHEMLALHHWPGDLAELRSVVVSAHAACQARLIEPGHLPVVIHQATQLVSRDHDKPEPIRLGEFLDRVERELIERSLGLAGGNKAEAARLLGVTRPRLYRSLDRLGLASPQGADADGADAAGGDADG
ncbi:C4-dicarboxylate transport transcriptional regulatory protein DctD [Pseudobythopirellula maris]|uniref:C4-dicarboxylate transport transcriptional regulatory protein DctD n=1 Tax=Pseudobythopirellula maris TaxID=2527991 RepID=A0A5C5ZJ69_9BACT|nr:helix-turn-helix domain-containing protein [Pseudobythopirellula maris]TWT86861.1 C4-dicarboxylate transport transcriptional regulatory protein DctD [Pseudobythopirellula maris]